MVRASIARFDAAERELFARNADENGDVRRAEGYSDEEGDVLLGLDNRFMAEWVPGDEAERGWAFRGDFWGKFGEVRELEGVGRESAEVWFGRVW